MKIDNEHGDMQDYRNAHCSFSCKCGLHFQFADARLMLTTATACGGDLAFNLQSELWPG